MTWTQLQRVFEDYGPIAIVTIALLLFVGLVHKSWPLISNFVTVVNALVQLPQVIDTVEDIRKEVKPNGGGSMRDVVNRTAAQVQSLEERFDEHLCTHPSQVPQRPTSNPPSAPRAPR